MGIWGIQPIYTQIRRNRTCTPPVPNRTGEGKRSPFVEDLGEEDLRLIAEARVPEDVDWDLDAD